MSLPFADFSRRVGIFFAAVLVQSDRSVELDFVEWMAVLAEARSMVPVHGAVSLRLKI